MHHFRTLVRMRLVRKKRILDKARTINMHDEAIICKNQSQIYD